ncbi:MAG: glycosyltransferase family 8 protein [Succinivibrionaceae bacterium]|jgi:lipopolysaccharide biosynthesis glycosyltransferase|nr:glycosyltransferase family 8 protein [Succinivibrionaceae bacterium]
MKNPINICLSFDEKYAQHAAVTMVSLMKNCSRNIHFYIIDSEPSGITESRSKIVKLVEMYGAKISFRTIDLSVFKGFPVWKPMQDSPNKYVPYYRLCLADLLPEIERIIYLDTDIVVQGDIAKLYDLEFAKDQFIAGVNDMDSEELKEKISTSAYINSGVILFDLATIRRIKLNVVEESIKILQNFRERISLNIDQDLINIIFNDHIRLLDISWNAQSVGTPRGFKLGYDDKSIEKNIIHFIASHKPWMFNCKSGYQHLYFRYLSYTPWKLKCIKYLFIKIKKFIFEKKNVSATQKIIVVFGLPLLKRSIEDKNKKVYRFLGFKVYEY